MKSMTLEFSRSAIVDLPKTSEGNLYCIVFTEAASGVLEAYKIFSEALATSEGSGMIE